MPQFLVQGNAVHQQANNMGATADELRRVLDAYANAVQNTFGTWLGLGASTMQQFLTQFLAIAGNLISALVALQTEVEATGRDYDTNETNQQQVVGTLNGALGGFNVPR